MRAKNPHPIVDFSSCGGGVEGNVRRVKTKKCQQNDNCQNARH